MAIDNTVTNTVENFVQSSRESRLAVAAIRSAGFPLAQMTALKQHLRRLSDVDDQIKAGIHCRKIDRENYLASGGAVIRLAVMGNFPSQAISDLLRSQLLGRGLLPEIYQSDYNQYCYELLNPTSELYLFAPEVALCLLDEHSILDEMSDAWSPEEFEQALVSKLNQLGDLAENFGTHSKGLLVFNTLVLSSETLRQRLDYRGRARISRVWAEFNAGLCALAERLSHVVVLDTQSLLTGDIALRDTRLGFYTKAYMSDGLLAEIARELTAVALAKSGKAKKCLVLDLDHTLWGGILGDDGVDGIQLSNTGPGEAFVAFQKTIRRFASQGVLLTVSSKNDIENVKKVLLERSDMVLKEDDFAAIFANWGPKSQSIAEISTILNIGRDSLVFVDDSAFERSEVGGTHPEVEIIEIHSEPAEHISALLNAHSFSQLELNSEDYKRSALYKTEARRQELRRKHSDSLTDFLQGLDLKLRLFPPQGYELSRVSQLTLRTNQFNLTTQRMSEHEVQHYLDQPDHGVVAMQSEDKFGDYGLIGCLFYQIKDDALQIDNFLLSCRVFSRGLETAMLNHLLDWAKQKGCTHAVANYLPTAKNINVADLYDKHGFVSTKLSEQHVSYHHPMHEIGTIPEYLELTATY